MRAVTVVQVCLAGLVLSFIACFILLVIAPLTTTLFVGTYRYSERSQAATAPARGLYVIRAFGKTEVNFSLVSNAKVYFLFIK